MHYPKLNFTRFFTSIAIAIAIIFIFIPVRASVNAATGINRQINFQGKLVNNPATTNVTNTSYTVVFTLYDDPDAGQGTVLWQETQAVTTVDGIFRVALGSQTAFPANFNFNWDGLYLGIKVNSDSEMTPRVQMAAVPFAFNAERVAGLTVQDTSGNASTSGTLQIANAKTVNLGTQNLTFTTSADTTLTLPTTGTLLTNTTAANQTITSTQTTGSILSLADSTGLSGAITGMAITLSGTGVQDQTGLSFNLSGASGTNLNDIVGTGSSWKVSKAGALTVAGVSIAAANSYTGAGAVALTSGGANALSLDTGGAAAINIGSTTNATSVSLCNSANCDTINIGNLATVDADTIIIGDTLDTFSIGSTAFNVSNTGALTGITTLAASGLISANGGITVAANNNLSMTSGTGLFTQTHTLASDATADSHTITLSAGGTGSTNVLRGFVISQADTATTGVFDSLAYITNLKTPETTTNGVLIEQNAASGTLTNGLQVLSTTGTLTNGILIADGAGTTTNGLVMTGTFATSLIDTPSFDVSGTGAVSGVTTLAASGAIAANGGITFDQSTDTLGAYTLGGDVAGNSKNITALAGLTVNAGGLISSATSGTLGIGTTTNTTGLTIGNSGATSGLIFNVDTAAHFVFQKEGSVYQCSGTDKLTLNSSGRLVCGTDQTGGGGGGYSPFQEITGVNGGVIAPNNSTMDFLVGGQSSATARFAVLGMDSDSDSTPTASISAGLTGGLYMAADGKIQTTNMQTITIGGDTTGNVVLNPSNGDGLVIIGSGSNKVTFDLVNGPTYSGTARPPKKIILSPEYPGASLTASNSATILGNLTSDASPSASWRTYYDWTSVYPSFQDYTVAVRITLPLDFSAWSTSINAIVINFNTELTTADTNKLDIILYSGDSSTPVAMRTNNVSSSEKTWTTVVIPASELEDDTSWNAADQTAVFYLKMYSKDDNYVQIGDIELNYLSAY